MKIDRDLRARIGAALDDLSDEQVRELILDGLSAEKLTWAFCPTCNAKVRVDYPDLDKRAKFIATFLDQAKGRPQETKNVNIRAGVLIADMTDEELAAVIDGNAREITSGG